MALGLAFVIDYSRKNDRPWRKRPKYSPDAFFPTHGSKPQLRTWVGMERKGDRRLVLLMLLHTLWYQELLSVRVWEKCHSESADFSMVLTNQVKQGSRKQEGFHRCYMQYPGRAVVQGEDNEGDKAMSQNNNYREISSRWQSIRVCAHLFLWEHRNHN